MSETFVIHQNLESTIRFKPITLAGSIEGRTKIIPEAYGANEGNMVGHTGPSGLRGFHPKQMNGFLYAIHLAFDRHLPLILSPDDVWVAISQGFSTHVNSHPEELRKKFVKHEGKILLEIQRDGFHKGSPENDWIGGFSEWSDAIANQVGKKRDLLIADFTTTGTIERAVSDIVLMDTVKSYFNFECRTLCGIPQITLLGTPEDWVRIKDKARNLSEFDCEDWIESLVCVLDEFVKAAKGAADIAFWKSFYKFDGGSGGPYVTGAVNVFFPYVGSKMTFNENAVSWQNRVCHFGGVNPSDFPMGISSVPFVWKYYEQTFSMQILGGFVGTSQNPTTGALRPVLGWGVADA